MKNSKLWAFAFSQFEALRLHIPDDLDENRIQEYHDLINQLQIASGEDFMRFRIPPREMCPRVTSIRMGTRRFPGQTNYSKDKYCDEDFFRRQIEGLSRYIATLNISSDDGGTVIGDKDYWSMNDQQLEQLARKYHIPSWGRTGKDGEHWYVNRDYIIEQLLKRDQALEGQKSMPTNVINVGSMQGSVIQQGTENSSAQVTFQTTTRCYYNFSQKLVKPLVNLNSRKLRNNNSL